jgi:hypothetical protein
MFRVAAVSDAAFNVEGEPRETATEHDATTNHR